VAFCIGLAAMPARGEARFALLIGSNVGWSHERPLRYAESDAEQVREVLVELGGFAPDRVVLLKDPDTATVRAHLRRLSRTVKDLGEESLVFVYYAGHADAHVLHLRGEPLSHAELLVSLQEMPATHKVSLRDVCLSGSARPGTPSPALEMKRSSALRTKGLALLRVNSADELSRGGRVPGGSRFTHHLVSGLRGAADLDGDGRVMLSEAWLHATRRTKADLPDLSLPWSAPQELDEDTGDLPLTELPEDAARLLLPQGEGERYGVVDEHEVRLVAEGHVRQEQRVSLVLPPGTYRVKRGRASALEVATLRLEPGARVSAESLTYEARPLGSAYLESNLEGLTPEARREWTQGRARALLAGGEVEGALRLLDEVLAEKPGDLGALRARARALVRKAEAQERAGNPQGVRESLRAALEADPVLAEDPTFAPWYQKLHGLEAEALRTQDIREVAVSESSRNPRSGHRWGLGLDVLGTRGTVAPVVSLILGDKWFPYLAVAPLAPGGDVGVRLVPLGWRWSPIVGVGVQLPFARLLHGPQATLTPGEDGWVDPEAAENIEQELRDGYLHLDLGIQYFGDGTLAPACELGVGLKVFQRPSIQFIGLRPSVNLGCGLFL
jgi:tetratricopeptide (TPR) repeat protein